MGLQVGAVGKLRPASTHSKNRTSTLSRGSHSLSDSTSTTLRLADKTIEMTLLLYCCSFTIIADSYVRSTLQLQHTLFVLFDSVNEIFYFRENHSVPEKGTKSLMSFSFWLGHRQKYWPVWKDRQTANIQHPTLSYKVDRRSAGEI